MADYTGCKCPVCQQPFSDGDDVVVCPECGAPYHRACYQKNAGCLFADRHAPGFEWKPAPGEMPNRETVSASQDEIACPACGAMNPAGGLFCESCGAPLRAGGPRYAPGSGPAASGPASYGPAAGPQGYSYTDAQQAAPGMLHPDEDLGGVKARDWAAFLGPNAGYYLMNFKRMAVTGQKLAISFSAFFFGPFYFFYRKMWLPAAIFLTLDVFGVYIPQLLQFLVLADSSLVAGLDLNVFSVVLNVLWVVNLAVQFAAGLFAVYWYRRIGEKRIARTLQSCSPAEAPAALAKAGGVSVIALVVSLSVVFGIYLLLSFMALAPMMAAPLAGMAV